MNLLDEVRPGANRYISGQGIINQLPEYLQDFENIVIVTGDASYRVFKNYYQHAFDYPTFIYDGSASEEDAHRLATDIKTADVILAIGGGRLIDTAKMVSENLGCDLFIIPTLISNCAPYAPVIVVYTQKDHQFKHVGMTLKSSFVTMVDYDFLLATPRDYLIAGIGDTLAKWYEIEGITRRLKEEDRTATVRLGITVAKEIFTTLTTESKAALEALSQKEVTPAFMRIADSIIALAGCVGGFAGEYGRVAGAHAIHDALSLLPETHQVLHGFKVAYGIFVQLAYTEDFAEIEKLLPIYEELTLPVKLAEVNIDGFDHEKLLPVATFAASCEAPFVLMAPEITADDILSAMKTLEAFIKTKQGAKKK